MMLHPALLVIALAALNSPERIARLSYVEGQVAFHAAQDSRPSALPDRPLIPGDRLVTEAGGRAELTLGTATARLDERTELVIADLDTTTVRVELASGTASVHLHELLDDESFKIVTSNTTIALAGPGEYRVESLEDGTTELNVHGGVAKVETAGGPVRVAAGQRVLLEGRDTYASLATPQPADAFDDWVMEREVQLADAEPSRYGLRDGDGYDELDRYGDWYEEPNYGRVWMPSYAYGGWDPFRHGHWERVGLRGRSWIHSTPWAFFTFHQGRWAFLHHQNRWCWVPERRDHRRHVANDTRPFGHPRGQAGSRDDGARRPVVATDTRVRRMDSDQRSTPKGEIASSERPQSRMLGRSTSREPSSPRPAATSSSGGQATMRPSSSSAARNAARSSTAAPTSRAFGRPQEP